MKPANNPNVIADLESFQPMGDFVLVKRSDQPYNDSRLIILPPGVTDGRIGIRRGTVVACGPGDLMPVWVCMKCLCTTYFLPRQKHDPRRGDIPQVAAAPILQPLSKCANCGTRDWQNGMTRDGRKSPCYGPHKFGHAAMNVRPGDDILYWRAPANDVTINGEDYVLLHEEQHILAVLEDERQCPHNEEAA